jgi:hypothetical protein
LSEFPQEETTLEETLQLAVPSDLKSPPETLQLAVPSDLKSPPETLQVAAPSDLKSQPETLKSLPETITIREDKDSNQVYHLFLPSGQYGSVISVILNRMMTKGGVAHVNLGNEERGGH